MRITRYTPSPQGMLPTGGVSLPAKPTATLAVRKTEYFSRLRTLIHNYAQSISELLTRHHNPIYSRAGLSEISPYPTVFAQSDIAIALARIGSREAAEINLQAAISVTDFRYRAYTISSAAIALIELGRGEEALPLLKEAKKIEIRRMRELHALRSFATRRTVEALVRLDRKAEAIKHITAASVQNPARAFIEISEFEQALNCSNPGKLEKAHALAGSGKIEAALALAEAVNPNDRIHMLSEIVIALIRSGNLAKAEEVLIEICNLNGRKCAPRTEIAIAFFRAGREEDALQAVGIPNAFVTGLKSYNSHQAFDLAGRFAQTLLQIDPAIASESRLAELSTYKASLQQAESEFAERLQLEQEDRAARAQADEDQRMAEARAQNAIALAAIQAERVLEERTDAFRYKMEEIISSIGEHLVAALGLEDQYSATTSNGDSGNYATVMHSSLSISQSLTIELSQANLAVIDVSEGVGIDALKRRLSCLNILVPHEVAHILQDARKIPHPKIAAYPTLDQKEAEQRANEVMLDKLGFDAARLIYVHGDGDLYSEWIREAIAIEAYSTFCEILLENLAADVHKLSNENAAQIVAVLDQMARREGIHHPTRIQLLKLAESFRQRIRDNSTAAQRTEFAQLIREYEAIFAATNLKID